MNDDARAPCASDDNVEWELADFADAVAAEFDRAEDTLALKSYARASLLSVKGVALDLPVTVRRSGDGRVLFRTAACGTAGAATLRLDFTPLLQSQVEGARRPLDAVGIPRALNALPGITPREVAALREVGVFTADDLERATPTVATVAAVARKTAIVEARLREWLELPWLSAVTPAAGPPGSRVTIEGGRLGTAPDAGAAVLFQGRAAKVESWSAERLVVQMPPDAVGHGQLAVVTRCGPTNALSWEAVQAAGRPRVGEVTFMPVAPSLGFTTLAEVRITNEGDRELPPFLVVWVIDGAPQPPRLHPVLVPQALSQDGATRFELRLTPGAHTVWVVVSPEGPNAVCARAELSVSPLGEHDRAAEMAA